MFFVKINKIGKALARFTKKKRERSKINKIRNETEEISDKTEILKNKKKNSVTAKLDNLKK